MSFTIEAKTIYTLWDFLSLVYLKIIWYDADAKEVQVSLLKICERRLKILMFPTSSYITNIKLVRKVTFIDAFGQTRVLMYL